MLPPERDELIASWLARIGRLYGALIKRLFAHAGHDPDTLDLAAVDLGPMARLWALSGLL